jgi:hypothetical protein
VDAYLYGWLDMFTEKRPRKLVAERESWRMDIQSGNFFVHELYEDYVLNRNSELWRSTRQLERLFEYIMYLEDKVTHQEGRTEL